jgi:2-furoyl-CoA dehydrogenase large subunit
MGYITTVLSPAERDQAGPKSGAQAAATVSLDPLGGVSVAIDSVPQGQGHRTATAQIVADIFGRARTRARPLSHDFVSVSDHLGSIRRVGMGSPAMSNCSATSRPA